MQPGQDAKKLLRKRILKKRDALSPEERREKSRAAGKRLFSLAEFQASSTILFFASFRSEMETLEMIEKSLSMNKRVGAPRTDARLKRLLLFFISHPAEDLLPGCWGIPEPREGCEPLSPKRVDLAVVPGAAFDRRGRRIGYGGGYYDRLLRELRFEAVTVGLAFSFQVLPEVPIDPEWDMPVKLIVTDEEVIRCS